MPLSSIDHPPGAAGRAKPATLTAEGNQVLMAAGIALDTQEPVPEQAALQVVVEFLAHEFWQMAATMLYRLND